MTSRRMTGRASPTDGPDAIDAGLPAPHALQFVGLRPTPYQARMKSKFWALVRDDPMVDPGTMSGMEIAQLLGEPAVSTWLRDDQFRQFFLNSDAWRHSLEWLSDMWIDQAFDRLLSPALETKDFISLGRELAKMTGRSGPGDAAAAAATQKQFTPEQARKAIETAARQMGWTPAQPATPEPAAPPEDLKQ